MKYLAVFSATWVLSLCATTADAADAAAPRRPLSTADFYRLRELTDPQVSPDGQWVAYVVTSNDRDADESRSAVWMVNWDGSPPLPLTNAVHGTSAPRWSPEGRYLAFISTPAGSDNGQIMLLDRRGGESRPLTNTTGEIGNYAWSPDGKHLVVVVEQSGANPVEMAKSSAAPEGPKPIVIDALHFKEDRDGYLGSGHGRHLYLLDAESKKIEALTNDPNFNEDLPVWSPDGRQIAFVRTRDKGPDSDGMTDIDVIDARAGSTARKVVRPYAPNDQKLAWSPDGKLIAYLQGLKPKYNAYMQDHLAVVAVTGGPPRPIADALDRAVKSYAFSPDGASIMVTVQDDVTVYPARIELRSGSITKMDQGASVVEALSAAGDHTAMLYSNDTAPAEIYALEAGHLRKLTGSNDAFLAEVQLGAVDDLRFKTKGGAEIHGLIVKPPGFVSGRKYPTILWIHGGPNNQDQHSFALNSYQFPRQLLAAGGFVVVGINYRGSTGRGSAFAQAILADWGHKEVEDLLAGADALIARGIADPNRLGIGGWSYGGILTDYTIATDRRFKAAFSGAGSANQLSMYGSDEYILQYNSEIGPPWRNPGLWIKLSYPFFHADRIHTPTLFMGGDKDFNVPVAGAEQMYEALRTLGVPTQLIVYPNQYHGLRRPTFLVDRIERVKRWFGQYLQEER